MIKEKIIQLDAAVKLKLINQGNTAEVYAYGEDKILKLYRNGMAKECCEEEYEKAVKIQNIIRNTPKVYGMAFYKERLGIIFERIMGQDMLAVMLRSPHKINYCAKELARLHVDIQKEIKDMSNTVKNKLRRDIENSKYLSEQEQQKVRRYMEALPDGSILCHLDFHPGNVMISDGDMVIIDWMNAAVGDPCADAARTCIMLRYARLPDINPLAGKMIHLFVCHIAKIYLKEYIRLSGICADSVEQWILPAAAARLTEWIPEEERKCLLRMIHHRLNGLR